jgi:hypothetical protein
MLNQNANLKTKTLKTIFVTIHLALISLGLVSCVQAPNPPEQTSPQKEQGNQQPGEATNEDDDDDKEDDKDDDKN